MLGGTAPVSIGDGRLYINSVEHKINIDFKLRITYI